MANAGITEVGNFFKSELVDGKPKKPATVTLDVNINGVIFCARDSGFLSLSVF